MAARTTVDAVKEIISTGIEDSAIQAHIDTANLMVDELLLDEGYSDNLLKQIEKWLAAHYVAVQDPRRRTENLGEDTITYEGKTGLEGFQQTRYGLQAMALDHHGILASTGQSKGQVKFKAT